MLEISDQLKENLSNTNHKLRIEYSIEDDLDDINLREKIQNELNEFIKLTKMSEQNLQNWLESQVIIGVDGSVNKAGSNYPHYISLLQALAKSTTREDIIKTDLFCPLLSTNRKEIDNFIENQRKKGFKTNEQDAASKIRTSKLAKLELAVALEAIERWQPKLVMLDGSLIRYRIEAESKWKKLKELAIEEEVLLLGVIEEIGTQEIGKRLGKKDRDQGNMAGKTMKKLANFYDRELLFGLLNEGEMLKLEFKSGFKTAFLRSSRDPQVIGIDVLKEQQVELKNMAELVYTLTPQDGRGIPLWLDIVDHEVKISDKMMESLIETYFDSDLKRRLFYSKRNRRIY